ncbi:MAG: DUF5711 family protein [Faecalibacterium sp.]|jgi:TolB protein|nr:DUF5711 family protein [Faecalibacterium sp.]
MTEDHTAGRAAQDSTAPASGGVSVLDELRRRKRLRKIRRFVGVVVVLAAILAWVTGLFGASLSAAGDLVDNVRLSTMRQDGYPAQTGLTELYQVAPLTGGYVALGTEGCLVYTDAGTRLRSLQPGYARPAIAAGTTRFILYNRGGTELRIESRTKTVFTKNYDNSILLSAMAANGTFAVVTEDTRYLAKLQICTSSMEELLAWNMTDTEGTPLRMAFSPDGKKLAAATLLAVDGQASSNLYLLDTRKDTETLLATATASVPLDIAWLSDGNLLVIYDDHAAVYSAVDGTEKSRYDYGGHTITGWSFCGDDTAILLSNGSSGSLAVLDKKLAELATAQTPAATGITLTKTAVYILTETAVECDALTGEYQWKQEYGTSPQALLEKKNLLVFQDGAVQTCEAPAES